MRVLTKIKSSFCFFNQQISQKYGQKCCRYNQNGQPMTQIKAKSVLAQLQSFLRGWRLNSQSTKLLKYYYSQDYPLVVEFLGQIVTIDANQFKQCPSFTVRNGQIVQLQLYSITLKGLSMLDFQLAMRINNINHQKYRLLELSDPQNYRKQIGKIRMKRQSERVQKMLEEDTKGWKSQKK